MSYKVLVADDHPNTRAGLVAVLDETGYEVIEARDGREALELALHEHPDVILLDVWMPFMDGFEVLQRLRETPATKSVPVILLTAMDARKGERTGMDLGATHYMTKPWDPGTLETAIRVALREAESLKDGAGDADVSYDPELEPVIRTGNTQMDQVLGRGLPLGSLTLIEGVPFSGKSVICQHLGWEALLDGRGVVYFTSDYGALDLIAQMKYLDRDVSEHIRDGKLAIYPISEPMGSTDDDDRQEPERMLSLLSVAIERLPSQYQVVFVDSITDLAVDGTESSIMGFFSSCKRTCENRRTIFVVARSYAFSDKALARLQGLCDSHLSLRAEQIGAKTVKMLEVRKLRNAELRTGNTVSFDVIEKIGLRIVPGSRVKV